MSHPKESATGNPSSERHDQYEYFLNIINNVPGAVLRFELFPDNTHRFVYLSAQAEKLWGISSSEALKNSNLLWEQILEEDTYEFKRTLIHSAKADKVWNHEWRIKTPKNEIKWLKGTGRPIIMENSIVWDTLILDISEQKNKEEELAKKKSILERTERLAKIGSWEVVPESKKVYWSDEIFKIFDLPLEEGTPPLDEQYKMLTPSSIERIQHVAEKAIEDQSNFSCEIHINKSDGSTTYGLLKGFYKFDQRGMPVKIYGSLQDISERKKIEQELQKSEAMFKNIADSIPGLVIRYKETKTDESVLFISKGYKTLFETELESDIITLDILKDKIHPDDKERFFESMQEAKENLSAWNQELRLQMVDGRIKWIEGRGQAQMSPDGDYIWDIMILDITESKKATDSIRALKDQLDLAIQTADLGVWKVDFIKNDIIWNDEVLKIYGLSRKEFNKNKDRWKSLVHPEDWPSVKQAAIDASKGKNAIRTSFRVIQLSGNTRHVIASASPYYQNNVITGIIGINLDITSFKRIEQDLMAAKLLAEKNEQAVIIKNDELKKANQELDNFVYRVSHDLRSPITSAIGLSQISLRSDNVEEIHQYDELRIQTLEKLDSFISEILNYSRNSRMPIAAEMIDFKAIVNKVLLEHQGTIQQQKLDIKLTVEQKTFIGDRMRISTILENLLSNAFKFINPFEPNPFVKISIKASEKEAKIIIQDNGIGIKKERQSKVFEMFYRGTDKHNGTGIGLYILSECLEKINGTIKLQSEEGKGTTFSLVLPSTE